MTDRHDRETTWSRLRWLRLALVASVSLNLLLGGLIVGAALHRAPADHGATTPLRAAMRAGPAEARAAARAALAQRRPEYRGLRRAVDEARAAAAAAVASEPFEPERLAAALARLRKTQARMVTLGHEALIETVTRTPPEHRAQIARSLEARARLGGESGRMRPR